MQRVMISTPCSGGALHYGYVISLLDTIRYAREEGLCDIAVHFQGKESLIHRARNRAADAFRLGEFDKLVTIDADIEWKWEDFKKLITSDKPIIGGLYPIKSFPVVMNFNPLEGKGREFVKSNRGYDYDAFKAFREHYADKDGLVEVFNVATGFLCVHRDVFAKLSETVDVYGTFQPDSGEKKGFFDFYPSKVVNHDLESEDWGFCRIAREAGFPIFADTSISLTHVGFWQFRLGQLYGEINEAASQAPGVKSQPG